MKKNKHTTFMSSDILPDVTEAVIDQFLEDGILKDIPIVKTCIQMVKTSHSIRDWFLLKKLIRFFNELEKITQEEKNTFFEDLDTNDKIVENIGNLCIFYLDKYDHEDKAKMIGKLLRAYINRSIDLEMYFRLMQAIDKAYIDDIYQIINHKNARHLPRITREQLYAIGLLKIRIRNKSNNFHNGNKGKNKKEMRLSTDFHPESETEYDYNTLSLIIKKYAV